VQQSVRKGCLLGRFKAGQQEGKSLSQLLKQQRCSVACGFGSVVVGLVELLQPETPVVASLVLGSPGQGEEGDGALPPATPSFTKCLLETRGFRSLPLSEAEEAANTLFHLGLNPL